MLDDFMLAIGFPEYYGWIGAVLMSALLIFVFGNLLRIFGYILGGLK